MKQAKWRYRTQAFPSVNIETTHSFEIRLGALLVTQLFLMGWVETKRWQEIRNPGSQADGGFLGIKEPFKGERR